MVDEMIDQHLDQLTTAIKAALNSTEAPLNNEHAQSVISIMCRLRDFKSFWVICKCQSLIEYRAWKFCHLLHKVLREGHESALKQSRNHRKMIVEIGMRCGDLEDNIGHCIKAYCKLLVTKINFHEKNRIFPGSLIILDDADIDIYAQNDINVHFQMCVEIFDYLEDLLEVQACVFKSFDTQHMSSMTPQGQCRLLPLVELIQESNALYDICMRLMFRLHDELTDDVLTGHRDRFHKLFCHLKQFYDNVRPLQYLDELIQLPELAEISPKFSSNTDLASYVTAAVSVPQEFESEQDFLIDNLEHGSFSQQQQQAPNELVPTPVLANLEILRFEESLRERDQKISELQSNLTATRQSAKFLEQHYKIKLNEMRENYEGLTQELAKANEQCAGMRLERDELQRELEKTISMLMTEVAKIKEETTKSVKNLNKLNSLSDKSIQLQAKHGETRKQLNIAREELEENQLEIISQELIASCAVTTPTSKARRQTESKAKLGDIH